MNEVHRQLDTEVHRRQCPHFIELGSTIERLDLSMLEFMSGRTIDSFLWRDLQAI